MKTEPKIVNNLMNLIIFLVKVSSLRHDVRYLEIINLSQNTYFTYKILQFGLTTFAHMLTWYEIYLNTTNYSIVNMQDLSYWLCTSILDCFGQFVIPTTIIQILFLVVYFVAGLYISQKCI